MPTRIPGKLTPAQYRVAMHIPLADNNGEDFDPIVIGGIEASILAIYGALTVTEACGVWQDGDRTYSDVQKIYTVDVNRENDIHHMRRLADVYRDTLGQQCIYVTVQTIHTYLV
jgi:hypothetical protein